MSKLNAFLIMASTFRAYTVNSISTGWVNDWDNPVDWSAESNRMMTGFYSEHNNKKEDRRWKIWHGSVERIRCDSRYLKGPLNDYDKVLSATCSQNEAVCGLKSQHHNTKEDRIWYFQCCKLTDVALKDMGLTGYLNDWDGVLDFRCQNNEVLTGLYSVHDNLREDRRWAARCAALVSVSDLQLQSEWTAWMNKFDEPLTFTAGSNRMITGFSSVHDNSKEDRRWKFFHGHSNSVQCIAQSDSGWVNDWDKVLSFTCPTNQALCGVSSYHNNGKEDRRWRFQCCRVASNFYLKKEAFTGYLNKWDEPIEFFCPSADEVIVGMYSYHDNGKEDRRWKARCAKLIFQVPDEQLIAL